MYIYVHTQKEKKEKEIYRLYKRKKFHLKKLREKIQDFILFFLWHAHLFLIIMILGSTQYISFCFSL